MYSYFIRICPLVLAITTYSWVLDVPDTRNVPFLGSFTVTLRQSECWRNINNPDSPRISNQQEYFFSLKTYFSPFSTFV